jgi:hypothetical protein
MTNHRRTDDSANEHVLSEHIREHRASRSRAPHRAVTGIGEAYAVRGLRTVVFPMSSLTKPARLR